MEKNIKIFCRYLKLSLKIVILILIRFYRCTISPFLGCRCRFHPSCSYYAEQAINEHGFFRGIFFSLSRILRCNPFHRSGFDPVPEKKLKSRK